MALIANLSIVLGANTQKAERSLNRSASIVDRLQRSVKGLAASFLAYVGVTRLLDGIGESFARIDRFAKAGTKLNLPIKDIQAFALAAELAGSNFETITKALSVLQRRASEARVGLSTAVRPLEQLNINVEKFNKLDTTQQFRVIAEAMKNVADQTDRARIANELFGRAGVELLPLLVGGAAALDNAAKAIERYGAGIEGFDGDKIQVANDAWTKLGFALNQIVDTLAIKLAPLVYATARTFIESVKPIGDAIRSVGEFFSTATGRVVAWVGATLAIVTVVPLVVGALLSLVKAFRALIGVQVVLSALKNPAFAIVAIGAAALAATKGMELLDNAMADFNEEIAAAQKSSEELARKDVLGGLLDDVDEIAGKLDSSFNNIADNFKSRADALRDSVKTPLEEFREQLEEIRELSSFLDPETVRRGVAKAVEDYTSKLGDGAPTAIIANVNAAERGTQEAFASQVTKTIEEQSEVQEDILAAQEEGNRTAEEILAEMKRQPRILPIGF